MKNYHSKILSFVLCVFVLSSCYLNEDPGPLQASEKSYGIVDFDRLEMGSAFIIKVEQSENFSIKVKGDSRNIDDLDVYKKGSTLVIKFDENRQGRKHDTYITITMPILEGVKFSGASESDISGFTNDRFDFTLSGASSSRVDVQALIMNVDLSGASHVNFTGTTQDLDADVSGASDLNAFNLEAYDAHVDVSGASKAKVNVVASLRAKASGASSIVYRGSPEVSSNTSGASSIRKD